MIPYWAVVIIIIVIVVGYFLLSASSKEKRREKVAADFSRVPGFHANQVFTDVGGEAAIGIDDRGRRIAVSRKGAQPRTQVYSFAHILSAVVLQDNRLVATVSKDGEVRDTPPDSLFGSTGPAIVPTVAVKPALGNMSMLAVRLTIQGAPGSGVLIRFYQGKPVGPESVAGEKAFADARVCLGALDIAIKRAALPPRPAISGRGLEPRS
jgi:hypothetical protein